MATLWLRLKAPFAAFRWLQAGVWRATSPIIPPSAAWGLVLNLAGIETRSSERDETTQVRHDAPVFELATGVDSGPAEASSLYQQLHTYPVGNSGEAFKPRTHGAKYWIAPVRRELLVGFEAVVGVRADETLLKQIVGGLRGELGSPRYGMPFAGDNSFLFDRIDVLDAPPALHWYARLRRSEVRRGSCRLTIGIDRNDASRTTAALFAPTVERSVLPPDEAWVFVPHEPAEIAA